jgi:hypothetical protein
MVIALLRASSFVPRFIALVLLFVLFPLLVLYYIYFYFAHGEIPSLTLARFFPSLYEYLLPTKQIIFNTVYLFVVESQVFFALCFVLVVSLVVSIIFEKVADIIEQSKNSSL